MATKISELRYEMQTLQNLLEKAIQLRDKSFKERETLRDENEALKVELSGIWVISKKFQKREVECLSELDAKDAQIRALVEALTATDEFLSDDYRTENGEDNLHLKVKLALSAIPAETLELYRLEREVVQWAKEWHYQNTDHSWAILANSVITLEAYKEGKR